jgi:hypothetical protein
LGRGASRASASFRTDEAKIVDWPTLLGVEHGGRVVAVMVSPWRISALVLPANARPAAIRSGAGSTGAALP